MIELKYNFNFASGLVSFAANTSFSLPRFEARRALGVCHPRQTCTHYDSLWVVTVGGRVTVQVPRVSIDLNVIIVLGKVVMRAEGLEPPRLSAPEPKSGASANFATPALWLYKQVFVLGKSV